MNWGGTGMSWKRSPELRPNVWDLLVVLAVLALAAGFALNSWGGGDSGSLSAQISIDGSVIRVVDLGALEEMEEEILTAGGYTLQLQLWPDGVEMVFSDCPTQDCVHTGKITRSGQSIVCLPARVIVALTGGGDSSGPDILIG